MKMSLTGAAAVPVGGRGGLASGRRGGLSEAPLSVSPGPPAARTRNADDDEARGIRPPTMVRSGAESHCVNCMIGLPLVAGLVARRRVYRTVSRLLPSGGCAALPLRSRA